MTVRKVLWIPLVIVVVLALGLLAGGSTKANAGGNNPDVVYNCPYTDRDACEEWLAAQGRQYNGTWAPTTDDMMCLTAAQETRSALVLYEGTNENRGTVVETYTNQYWELDSRGFYVKEVCVKTYKVRGVAMVLCGDKSVEFSSAEVQHWKRVKRIPNWDLARMWAGG